MDLLLSCLLMGQGSLFVHTLPLPNLVHIQPLPDQVHGLITMPKTLTEATAGKVRFWKPFHPPVYLLLNCSYVPSSIAITQIVIIWDPYLIKHADLHLHLNHLWKLRPQR